jgi:hypothetical protein
MAPQPVDVVGDGALDLVLRPETGVGLQPGDVEDRGAVVTMDSPESTRRRYETR